MCVCVCVRVCHIATSLLFWHAATLAYARAGVCRVNGGLSEEPLTEVAVEVLRVGLGAGGDETSHEPGGAVPAVTSGHAHSAVEHVVRTSTATRNLLQTHRKQQMRINRGHRHGHTMHSVVCKVMVDPVT